MVSGKTKYWRYALRSIFGVASASIVLLVLDLQPGSVRATLRAHVENPRHSQAPANAGVAADQQLAAPQGFQALTPEQAVAANQKVPISSAPNPPAKPFVLGDASATDRARALNCLTSAVYYEAANQGPQGEAAVAQVVLNRVRNPIFPKTICGVVLQGSNLPTGCQFTFTCDGSLARHPSATLWRAARDVAERALNGFVQGDVGVATHYHTIWVVPYWQSSVVKVRQIGAHVFYRMEGELGSPRLFTARYTGAEIDPKILNGAEAIGSALASEPKLEASSPIVAVADPAPKIVEQPVKAIEVASIPASVSPQDILGAAGQPKPTGYFGRPRAAQRLPMASQF